MPRTQQEIQEIYKLWDLGVTNKTEISRRMNIPRTTVRRILSGRGLDKTEPFVKGSVALVLRGTKEEGRVVLISSGEGVGMLFKLFGKKKTPTWKCQWWVIDDPRVANMVGSKLVLCAKKDSPAYLGGVVTKVTSLNGRWVIEFQEDTSLRGYENHIGKAWDNDRWFVV